MADRGTARHHHHLDRRSRARLLLVVLGGACALVIGWQALELYWSRLLPGPRWNLDDNTTDC